MLITGHRGNSSEAPENTLSAIELAIAAGADFVEVDVQLSKDGRLVLLHDHHLLRLAGLDKFIWDVTYDELRELDIGSWFSEAFAGERIPCLEEVFEVTQGKVKLNLELKVNSQQKHLAKSVVDLINQSGFEGVISSFDYPSLHMVKQLNPQLSRGLIMAREVPDWLSLEVDFYSVYFKVATSAFIDKCHGNKRGIHVWTVNEVEDMKRLRDLGVDNLITDVPEIAKKIFD